MSNFYEFVKESNKIEGIFREPTEQEIKAHEDMFSLTEVTVEDLITFVSIIQPDAVIRDKPHLNVRVGNHFPPNGGKHIIPKLNTILLSVHQGLLTPYQNHVDYETLHPFTDGNGRSGRALWLHDMGVVPSIGFLHTWYYHSLNESRKG